MDENKEKIKRVKELLDKTSHVLIAGGEYLSEEAGLDMYGDMFTDNFQDFIERYGFTNMYNGTFYPYSHEEERWAYLARYFYTYHTFKATELYKKLFQLVEKKDYFVITKNFDEQFYKAGFKKSRVYASTGDYRHLQCREGCSNDLYDFVDLMERMVKQTDRDRMIPTQLIPKCPKCGGLMDLHFTSNENFIKDSSFAKQHEKYGRFTTRCENEKTLVFDFENTKTFERTVLGNKNWTLVQFDKEKGKLRSKGSSLFKSIQGKNKIENIISFEGKIEPIIDQLLK